MNLEQITPLIITYNEVENLSRTLTGLTWAKQIVVIDSGSTDGTLELLALDRRIQTIYHKFEHFAEQCQFGVDQINSPWVLSLDADYLITQEFVNELVQLPESPANDAYQARFQFSVNGSILRNCLYPPRIILFLKGTVKYENDGHGHRAVALTSMSKLSTPVIHDDRKPFPRWFAAQKTYARQEADKLYHASAEFLPLQDQTRKYIIVAPIAILLYCLVIKLLILDGLPGLHYTLQRTLSESLLSLELIKKHLSS